MTKASGQLVALAITIASLSIGIGSNGRILLKCHTGCTVDAIVKAIGLTLSDLLEGKGSDISPRSNATVQQSNGCTLDEYASLKRLPVKFLRSNGLATISFIGQKAIRIPYLDVTGAEAAVQFRLSINKEPDGTDNRFRWRKGSQTCLYGLWRLQKARSAAYVVLVEGAPDSHTLWFNNISALGLPGAGNWNDARDAQFLDGIPEIYVVIEPDKGGERVLKWLGDSCIRDRVRLLDLAPHKDPSELYVADPARFIERWQTALKNSVP